jgi:glucose/mannose-6-phosphate isomerase
MTAALTREGIAAIDSRSMLADVLEQPAQVEDAVWRAESAGAPAVDAPEGLVVCGMGGSAIGGDLARACVGGRAEAPIRVVRDYAPEPWASDGSLVLLASYSGETEETLACFEAARDLGAPRVALTTGGTLADAARADGMPVIGVPGGLTPRAAVVYMTVATLECAALCGAAPSLRDELEAAATLLGRLVEEWGPEGDDRTESKRLARELEGRVPVVYGAGATAPVARRWKTQLNENAEVPAFFAALPDADHNEICGLPGAAELAPFQAVLLRDPTHDDRLARRLALTGKLASAAGAGGSSVGARGETPTERVMSLVLLGDLVSVYLAALRGVDPTPVEAIESFKRALTEEEAAHEASEPGP